MTEDVFVTDGWAEIFGDWVQEENKRIIHKGERDGGIIDRLYINNAKTSDGLIKARINILSDTGGEKQAQLVFRYIDFQRYYFAGIGGFHKKFCIGKRTPGGWLALIVLGEETEVNLNTEFDIRVTFIGTRIVLDLGDVRIAEYNDITSPYLSGNIGLRTWNQNKVIFERVSLKQEKPKSFVLMPFDKKYEDLYNNFIKKLLGEVGFEVKRADEIFGTRPIIQDIVENIQKNRLVVAFVTEKNPNVFYEIGIAHTLNKDVIILTDDVNKLPFDIRHLRCIQYDDSLAGSEKVRRDLKETVDQILNKNY